MGVKAVGGSGGGGGATAWTDLTDTPGSISALQLVRGNAGGTALEFISPASLTGIVHANLSGLTADDHPNYLYTTPQSTAGAGRAGGQFLVGGTAAGEELYLRGTSNANLGQVRVGSPIDFDDISAANALNPYFVQANPTQSFSATFIGGGVNISPTITFTGPTFIWEGLRIAPNITSGVNPGFAALTLLNALTVLRSTGGFNPLNSLTLNIGVVAENAGVATAITQATNFGISFSPQCRVTAAFGTMSITNQTAVSCRPTFSTIATSTANLGTIRGLHMQEPIVALFQPSAGTETLTALIGVEVDAVPFGGNVTKRALRSALTAATNTLMIENTGGALSDFGSGSAHWDDTAGIHLGNTVAAPDLQMGWAGASNELFFQFNALVNQLRFSNPSSGRFLFDSPIASHEFNLNCDRASIGDQTGAVGNQFLALVAPARTITVGGEYSSVLFTQSGNLTINANLNVFTCTWNAPSMTAGTGTVTTAAAVNIGGNPNLGTNRIGVRIISNPSGGGGVNAALWVTDGLTQLDGDALIAGSGQSLGFYGTTPVAIAAAYTVTNPVDRRTFDTTTVTLQQLAEVVGTVIIDDQAMGLRA